MREIHIDLSSDNHLQQLKVFGGYVGEHKETKLVVTLPSRLLTNDISYYYFDFQTALDEHITSPNIYKRELVDGNKVTILLWEQLLPTEGNLTFCVSATQTKSNGDFILKGKTLTCYLQILKSPTGEETTINVDSTKEDLQQAIDSALQTAKDSGEFQGSKGDPFTYEDFTPEQLADLKGNTGNPGVYYGTEEPTDPSHPIWINPEAAMETLPGLIEIEEGTWTPTLVGYYNDSPTTPDDISYIKPQDDPYALPNSEKETSVMWGIFKRIDNLVYVSCYIDTEITECMCGLKAYIGGLPYVGRGKPDNSEIAPIELFGNRQALSPTICQGAISKQPYDDKLSKNDYTESSTYDGVSMYVAPSGNVSIRTASGLNAKAYYTTGKIRLGFSGCYLIGGKL